LGYYFNNANWLEIGFDRPGGSWYSRILKDGKEELIKNKLSKDFNFNAYHSITVLKNDKRFEIMIDDNPV
jgi:hypothetical protein